MIPARTYCIRVFQPGYGPKIIACLMSDLEPIAPAAASDLRTQNIVFSIAADPPNATNLPAGNYSNTIANSGYLVGDICTTPSSTYRCTAAGSKTSSTWQQVGSGGGLNAGFYDNTKAYTPGYIVRVTTTQTIGGVTLLPGTYCCVASVSAGGTGNQVPQYPEPTSGTLYWIMIALGPIQFTSCGSSGGQTVYVNATAQF